MLIFDDLYIGEKLISKKKKIINALRHGKLYDKNLYVIYLNSNTNFPEIMHGYFFNQIYFQASYIQLLGFTDTKADAVEYLARFIATKYDAVL